MTIFLDHRIHRKNKDGMFYCVDLLLFLKSLGLHRMQMSTFSLEVKVRESTKQTPSVSGRFVCVHLSIHFVLGGIIVHSKSGLEDITRACTIYLILHFVEVERLGLDGFLLILFAFVYYK
jgi:hypothetical protein